MRIRLALLVALIAGVLWWALHAGQYDDLDRPGEAILLDNDTPPGAERVR